MKVDLSKIKLVDIDGKRLKDDKGKEIGAHNLIAKVLYAHSLENLDLVDIALKMNKGLSVEMPPSYIKEMRELMKGRLAAFVRKRALDYLYDLEEKEKKKNKKARV